MPCLVSKLAAVALMLGAGAATEDTKRPPEIDFGNSTKPRFKIFPGGVKSRNASWMMLEFGRIHEMGPAGNVIQSRAIGSLASEPNISFTATNTTMYSVSAQKVEMNLTLRFNVSDCPPGSGATPPRGDSTTAGSIAVRTIIFNEDAEVPYDNYTVPITKGQMKFDIMAVDWPFCGPNNSLTFALILKTPSEEGGQKERAPKAIKPRPPAPNRTGGAPQTAAESRELRRPPSKQLSADGGPEADVSIDLPEIVLVDRRARTCDVDTVQEEGRTVIKFKFPFFADTLMYDPVVAFETPATANAATVSGEGRASAWPAMALGLAGFTLPCWAQ